MTMVLSRTKRLVLFWSVTIVVAAAMFFWGTLGADAAGRTRERLTGLAGILTGSFLLLSRNLIKLPAGGPSGQIRVVQIARVRMRFVGVTVMLIGTEQLMPVSDGRPQVAVVFCAAVVMTASYMKLPRRLFTFPDGAG